MQSLHSSRVAPYPLDVSQQPAPAAAAEADDPRGLSAAVEARTYWACFIMDCTINSGLYTPRMLTMAEMRKLRVSRPLSTVEFAFGTPPGPETTDDPPPEPRPLDPSQSFEMLVGGFDIYAQVMAFIFDDGRRAPGMCAPSQCPWVPGSLWDTCRARLERWRAGQHATLHYPENSVAVHMTLGYGESFVYLNLLYYMWSVSPSTHPRQHTDTPSRIMLQREYSPFLPTPEMTPRGPVDPPMLEAEAPPGWWDDGARELFASGEHIASLLHDAAQCGVSVCTPFTGFCAFTACFLNLYVTHFPNMNLGRSRTSRVSLDRGNQYLREFKGVWALGDGWVRNLSLSLQCKKTNMLIFTRSRRSRTRPSSLSAPRPTASGTGTSRASTLTCCTSPSTSSASSTAPSSTCSRSTGPRRSPRAPRTTAARTLRGRPWKGCWRAWKMCWTTRCRACGQTGGRRWRTSTCRGPLRGVSLGEGQIISRP